jgi:hypothetical protein
MIVINMQDARYKIQDTRYKIQDTRYKIQDTRYKIQDYYNAALIFVKWSPQCYKNACKETLYAF